MGFGLSFIVLCNIFAHVTDSTVKCCVIYSSGRWCFIIKAIHQQNINWQLFYISVDSSKHDIHTNKCWCQRFSCQNSNNSIIFGFSHLILSYCLLLYPRGLWDVIALSPLFKGTRGLLELIPVISPERVSSSSQGPYLWQRPPHKVSTAHQFDLAQGYFDMQLSSAPGEPGFKPATFRSLATFSTSWATATPHLWVLNWKK